jgi:hypothetical protein
MTKQPAENTNATVDEEQAAKRRVTPERLFTNEDEAEVCRLAGELDDPNNGREVVRERKIATRHA